MNIPVNEQETVINFTRDSDKWYACPLESEPKPEDFMTEEKVYEGCTR